jgi:hypothetical protein
MEQDREDRPKTSRPAGPLVPFARGGPAKLGSSLGMHPWEFAQDGCRDVQPRPPPLAGWTGASAGPLGGTDASLYYVGGSSSELHGSISGER